MAACHHRHPHDTASSSRHNITGGKEERNLNVSLCHADLQVTWQANTVSAGTEEHLYYNEDLKVCDLDHFQDSLPFNFTLREL